MSPYSKTDIPFSADLSGRFVPWIVALMVYLATISLVVACSMGTLVHRWNAGFSSRLTIEIPQGSGETPEIQESKSKEREQILQALLKTPGISSVRTLTREEMIEDLYPWIGSKDELSLLPFPTLLEAEIADRSLVNLDGLQKMFASHFPGVRIEDHLPWQRGILNLAYSAQIIGLLIVSMIILASIGTIAFTSQTSLIIHRNVIEILYLMGATSSYIGRQFQNHAMRIGIKGGIVGFLLSAGTLSFLKFLTYKLESPLFDGEFSNILLWLIAILVPCFVTFFMMISARLAVRIALRYVL